MSANTNVVSEGRNSVPFQAPIVEMHVLNDSIHLQRTPITIFLFVLVLYSSQHYYMQLSIIQNQISTNK